MTTPNNTSQLLLAPSLNLTGCLQEYQQLRAGSVYWLGLETQADALNLATQVLAGLSANLRTILVGGEAITTVIAALAPDQGPAELRSYVWRSTGSKAVMSLTQQLDRKLRPQQRLIICLLSAQQLQSVARKLSPLLKQWRDWCESNGCTLLVLAYEQHAHSALELDSRCVAGVAYLIRHADAMTYRLAYWSNSLGVQGATDFAVHREGTHLILEQNSNNVSAVQTTEVFLQRSVLEGAPLPMAQQWHIVEDWSQLEQEALNSVTGIFVFALQASSEIEALARVLYAVRQQRGVSVQLVVREMEQALRNQEVELLLQCGAAAVIGVDTNLARFFSRLESLPAPHKQRPLLDDLELALLKTRPLNIKGVLSLLEFTSYLNRLLQRLNAPDTGGVLVSMSPAHMLTAEQLVSQLHIVRQGDAACVADDVVYLFLFSCQLNYLETVLRKIFSLPFTDLISTYMVHSERNDILDHIRRLQRLQVQPLTVDFSKASTAQDTTDPVEQQQSASVKFIPRLKPVPSRHLTKP